MFDFWRVAVEAPLKEPLIYRAPDHLKTLLLPGTRVHLPLGKRKVQGVLLEGKSEAPSFETKEIFEIDCQHPPLPDNYQKWTLWLSDYYCYPIGEVAALTRPPLKKSAPKSGASNEFLATPAPTLSSEQQHVISRISSNKGFSAHLLHGVTGSGKTEVYLRLLGDILQKNQQGLVIVPEISLTPQLLSRFTARFGHQVAIMHSQLTPREKTNQWWDIVEGRKSILIGARSALFCPIPRLGLIIVDEEHEPSFKQEEKLKYHGRDAAISLAKHSQISCVLGSATPSLETWQNAQSGKYHLHTMAQRVLGQSLPSIEVVDLKLYKPEPSLPAWLSRPLFSSITESLQGGDQVALFLNRRGIASLTICEACGFHFECPNCDISLTLHGRTELVCHYCDYHTHQPDHCPSCKEGELKPIGLGTELVEKEIQKLFPDSVVARADRDEIQNRHHLEQLIHDMETGKINILIGTQMIAKGLDFPRLNLVGLILADVGFNLPDFRATERSFQLITQMSGRAGRHGQGRVIVQTYNPSHPSLVFAKNHDYVGFAQQELSQRAALHYPPFGRLAAFRLSGREHQRVVRASQELAHRARQLLPHLMSENVSVLGPAEAPLSKLRGKFRHHLLLKADTASTLLKLTRKLYKEDDWLPAGVRMSVDIDPIHLL